MKKILGALSLVTLCISIMSMDTQDFTAYAIPGQNGLGSSSPYVAQFFYGKRSDQIVQVPTPHIFPDLGQNWCLHYLRSTLEKNRDKNAFIHATSQATATVLNYLAHEDKKNLIKVAIFEAVLVSGNSAIEHTLQGPLANMAYLTQLPFAYYWIPYLAKIHFPLYWPAGKQPIKGLDTINKNTLIIIIHSKKDPQLSYTDACALYYGLRKNGNNNVYFLSKEGSLHIEIADYINQQIIREILMQHGLINIPKETAPEALISNHDMPEAIKKYQPDHQQFKDCYDTLVHKEKIHSRIGTFLSVVVIAVLIGSIIHYILTGISTRGTSALQLSPSI